MQVDATTLRDLDILSSSVSRGSTVFALLDHTRTNAGQEALRQSLAHPNQAMDAIRDLQLAHRVLARESNTYRAALNHADTDAVEALLNSKWYLPDHRPVRQLLDLVLHPLRFLLYRRDVANSQFRMAVFLNGIADLGELLRSSESSTLRHRGNTLLGLLSTLDIQTLGVLCGRRSPIVQMRFDRLARLTAKGTLQELVALVASVEAMWSMAFAAADLQWSYPEPSDRFRVEGLCHPLLRDQGAHNNLDLDPRTRVCIITGPNMAGKSTFIKAVGIALLLAHAGCGVPARSMEFQPMAGIFAAIQVADDLRRGESLYLAELRRVKSLAMLLQQQSAIAILDELFRGTNILDANDATVAVLS